MEKAVFGLIGAGGLGRETMPYVKTSVAQTLGMAPDLVSVFFVETDEPTKSQVNGYPLISLNEFLRLDGCRYFNVAIGNGRVREAVARKVATSALPLSIQAPQTIFMDSNNIGAGAIFSPNSMVTSNVKIGRFFHANIYSYVAHDCVIGDFVTFAPGVKCNGRVHIEDHVYIGAGAVIKEGSPAKPLRIGTGAVIGMGAIVTRDVPEGATVVGNPARSMVR